RVHPDLSRRRQALLPALRAPAGGEPDRDVSGPRRSLELTGEHHVEGVVVADRGEGRSVDRERDRGDRLSLQVEAPRQLTHHVLRVRRRAAVAEENDLVAGADGVYPGLGDPSHGAGLGEERVLHADRFLDARLDLSSGDHAAPSLAVLRRGADYGSIPCQVATPVERIMRSTASAIRSQEYSTRFSWILGMNRCSKPSS